MSHLRIGPCQNLIRGTREDWRDAHYCGAPVIDLGIPGLRNVCQVCHAHAQATVADTIKRFVVATASDAEWIAQMEGSIGELDAYVVRLLRMGVRLSRVRPLQAILERKIRLLAQVIGKPLAV